MNALTARHMFWQGQAPRAGRRLQTQPMGSGVRNVLMAGSPFTAPMQGPFLGEDLIAPNRLDQVSIPAIIGRIQLAPVIQAYLSGVATKNATMKGSQLGAPASPQLGFMIAPRPQPTPTPNFPGMTEAEAQILFEVSKNPTADELEDLATIDNLFSQNFVDSYTTTNEVCFYANPKHRESFGFSKFAAQPKAVTGESALMDFLHPPPVQNPGRWYKPPPLPDLSFMGDKFWCPDLNTLGPTIFQAYLPEVGKYTSFAAMFGIDTTKTWGDVKLATQNGLTMLKVKASYPLPPPTDMAADYTWNAAAAPHTAEIANLGVLTDPESFRVWYTMAVLENYDAVTDAIIAEQKRKAKKAKRKAILKAVAFTIAGIVLAFIVPAIIAAAASAIKAAVTAYIDAKKRAEAAKAMSEAAKMFEADAPAFAKEVQNAADVMDEAAAMEAANQPLTPEQIEAIQEVKDNPEPGQESTTNAGTLLVGGVAATGIAAGLIALLR